MRQFNQKWLVVGGGISGLTAAQCLQDSNVDYRLIEQCPTLGGLTRTAEVANYCFDYTGHFLHLSRYKTPSQVPYAGLHDDDWQTVQRRSYFYVAGKFINAPIQYHLGELPPDMLRECKESYEARPKFQNGPTTFRDYIIGGFGQAVADRFLIPQNEKTMATTLERLSMNAVKRFFPAPHEDRIRQGFAPNVSSVPEYNSNFWYPKTGGIGLLVDGLSKGLKNVSVREEVAKIDLANRRVTTTAGHQLSWEVMLPSLPLNVLCELTGDPELRDAAKNYTCSATISFNIGLRTTLPGELHDAHWIYVPDRSIPFYRFGCYSNISKGTCTPGHSGLYIEVAVPGEAIDQVDVVGRLQPEVIASLENVGWIRSEDIDCCVTHIMRCAYVHLTLDREQSIEKIMSRLRTFGIYPIGRYGLWDYTGMEDSIESAISTVKGLL